jgi:hypothetical protein
MTWELEKPLIKRHRIKRTLFGAVLVLQYRYRRPAESIGSYDYKYADAKVVYDD